MLILLACNAPSVDIPTPSPAEPEAPEEAPAASSQQDTGVHGSFWPFGSGGGEREDTGEASPEPAWATGDHVAWRAHPVRGSVSSIALDGVRAEVVLGGWPTDVVDSSGDPIVSLRSEGRVVRLDGDTLEVESFASVGAEPTALCNEPGDVFVAVQQEDRVVRLTQHMEPVEAFDVGGQLRWLTCTEDQVIAVPTLGNEVVHIDVDSGVTRALDMPDEITTFDVISGDEVAATLRFTGSPDMDDERLMVPGLVVDTTTREDVVESTAYYGQDAVTGQYPGRFTPVVVVWGLEDGVPVDEPVLVTLVTHIEDLDYARSYPSAVVIGPDERAWATMPGAHGAVYLGLQSLRAGDPEHWLDYHVANRMFVRIDDQPEDAVPLDEDVVLLLGRHGTAKELELDVDWATAVEELDDGVPTTIVELDATLERGRELFGTATNPHMSRKGSGITCDTCHFEGRTDGLTWPLSEGDRQTPSLAGVVSDTAPFTWSNEVASVENEILITSAGRMGGTGAPNTFQEAVAAWIDATPAVDVSSRANTDLNALLPGEQLFEQTGCGDCHVPPLYTDQKSWDMFDDTVDTPSLLGVAATAPYFHDGSAETLEDAIRLSTDGGMADTAHLSDEEIEQLADFLRSLE